MEDKELQDLVTSLVEQGESEEVIAEVIKQWEPSGKTQGAVETDAAVAPEDGASSLEDYFAGLPTQEERAREEHNLGAEAAQGTISSVTGVPKLGVQAAAAFLQTFASLGEGLNKAEAGIKLTLGELFHPEAAEELKANPEARVALFDALDKESLGADELGGLITQHEEGITGSLAQGDIGDAASQAVVQTAGAIPSLLATATGVGGIAVLGISTLGSSYEESLEANPEESSLKLLGTSTLKAGYEVASEYATRGILKRAGLVFGKQGKEAAKEYAESALKTVWKDFNVEGVSEAAADFAGRVTDSIAYGTEMDPVTVLKELADTYLIGGIVGGGASTIGVANQTNRKLVENVTETKEKAEADKKAAAVINTTEDAKKTAGGPEDLSVLNDIINQEKEGIKERQEDHKRTVDDMTTEETQDILKDKAELGSVERAAENPSNSPEVNEVYEAKIKQLEDKINQLYTVINEWPATIEKADQIKEEITEKRKDLDDQEKTLAKSENPNPASTRKIKKARKELKEKENGLNEALTEARPTHAESKTRKRKAKVKPKEVDKTVVKPIRDKQQRTEANEDLIQTIQDPNIPDSQKERAYSNFFKVNAPLVTSIANTAKNKSYSNRSVSEVRDLVKTEIAKRIGEGSKVDNKLYNNAAKAVERLIKQEDTTVRSPRKESIKEELREIDQQVLDGILDAEAAEILKDDIRAEQDQVSTEGFQTTEEGEVILPKEIEAAYPEEATNTEKEQIETVLKEAGGIDKLLNEIQSNTDKIFALLPAKAKSGKAFSGVFSNGNPPVEIWESYFDQSDRQGKDRVRQLKKSINERIADATDPDITPQLEFQEANKALKPDVKTFIPLIGKLKRAFPGVKVIISKARMIEDFIEAGIDPGKADTVKGYTDGSTVVLNPEKLDLETPIHEFGHLWAQATRSERPELYQKGVELVKKSPYWLELQEKAKDPDSVYYGHSTTRLEEEAMATAIGQAGSQLYDTAPEQSAWDRLRGQIMDWLSKKMGVQKIEDLTFDQFLKIASTEIITGRKTILPQDVVDITNPDSMINALEVPVGRTRDYTPQTPPLTEVDSHGVFKGVTLSKEIDGIIEKNTDKLQVGGWIGYTTGKYGDAVPSNKVNPKLNDRIEAKVEGMRKYLNSKGYTFRQDPRNPGFHIIRKKPTLSFQEESIDKKLKDLLNLKGKIYKDQSPYKKSKVTQEIRDIVDATRRDFALRGHTLDESQKEVLAVKLDALVKQGVTERQEQKKQNKEHRERIANEALEATNKAANRDFSKMGATEIANLAKKRSSFIERIKKTRLSNLLAPAANNDFYGQISDLNAQELVKEALVDPLETANYTHLELKGAMEQRWKDMKQISGITKKTLDKPSTIIHGGRPLSNSQVLKVYNYIKDPLLYKQMEADGFSFDKMEQVLDYLQANPKLRELGDNIPQLYAPVKELINEKLDQHGYKGVAEPTIIRPEAGPALEILSRVYNGNIPSQAPYTPFTATGTDDYIAELEAKLENDQDFYSVMSGNLKQRTRGGKMNISGTNLESDLSNYMRGPLRSVSYMDFYKSAQPFFGGDNLKAMEATFGKEWGSSMRDSLRRIVTGRTVPTNESEGIKRVRNFINNTVAGIMFLNMRSAVLQLISTGNYAVESPTAYVKGISDPKAVKKALKLIQSSQWFKERGRGKTQLETSEVFGQEKESAAGRALQNLLQFGYKLTQFGDKGAIAMGGAPYVAGLIKEGKTEAEALKEFIARSEETQQSTRPERLGREQTSAFGRSILAFANTPMQYNRVMARELKTLVRKGSTTNDKVKALRKIAYYGAIQNAIFTGLQTALWTALDLEDEEDESKVVDALNSMSNTILRGSGVYGAAIATLKDILIQVSRGDDRTMAKKAVSALVNTSPALGTKVRQLEKALTPKQYPQSKGPISVPAAAVRGANAVTFITNIPVDRALKKFEGLNDAFSQDMNELEKSMRVMGWSRYNLKGKEKGVEFENTIFDYDLPNTEEYENPYTGEAEIIDLDKEPENPYK